jgi:hypothetical protein
MIRATISKQKATKAFRNFRGLLASQTASSLTSLPPVLHHQHDVHDVNIAIVINVVAGTIAPIPAFAVPLVRHLHDVRDVYLAIFAEVSNKRIETLASSSNYPLPIRCLTAAATWSRGDQ